MGGIEIVTLSFSFFLREKSTNKVRFQNIFISFVFKIFSTLWNKGLGINFSLGLVNPTLPNACLIL